MSANVCVCKCVVWGCANLFIHALRCLCANRLSFKFYTESIIGLLALVNRHTHAYLTAHSPLWSLVVLAASLALVPSTCRSSVPGSDWAENWRLGKVWSSERLLPTGQQHRERCQLPLRKSGSELHVWASLSNSPSSPLLFVLLLMVLMEGVEEAARSGPPAAFRRFARGLCSSLRPWSWCSRWLRILITASFSKIWA